MRLSLKAAILMSVPALVACGQPPGSCIFPPCTVAGDSRQVLSSPSEAAQVPEHRTLAPNGLSKVSIQTLPNAGCDLVADGARTATHLQSDEQGVVSFNAEPTADEDQTAELNLTCVDATGAQRLHAIQLDLDTAKRGESRPEGWLHLSE